MVAFIFVLFWILCIIVALLVFDWFPFCMKLVLDFAKEIEITDIVYILDCGP